jgi:Dolichyl-phosphate-mannose-protein mannosyltransferase
MNRNLATGRLEWILFAFIIALIGLVYFATFYPDQGWGDDFAQYLHQAANLAEGQNMADTGYIYSRYTPVLGPRAYPPGFPLLLAPIYAIWGLNMTAFQIYMIALQLVSLVVIYLLYRAEVSLPTALILLVMMGLSPYFIAFKRAIMSDVPFMLFCIAFLVWVERVYRQQRFGRWSILVAVVLAFICYLIRTIGFVVLAALLVSDLLRRRSITRFTLFTIAGTVALVVISRFVIGGGEESYFDQFEGYSISMLFQNFSYYLVGQIRAFWAGPSIRLGAEIILPILYLAASPLIIYGFVRRARRSTLLIEMFFVFYLGVILAWPSVQELRFLYPILPLVLLYTGVGFEGVLKMFSKRLPQRVMQSAAVGVALGILVIYGVRVTDVIAEETWVRDGPYTAASQELFKFIADETDSSAIFVFFKPRALSLYTDRAGSTFPWTQTIPIAADYLNEIQADYAVLMKTSDDANIRLAEFIQAQPAAFDSVFSSEQFEVYRLKRDQLVVAS